MRKDEKQTAIDALTKCATEIEWALNSFAFVKREQSDRGNCYFQLEQASIEARAAIAELSKDVSQTAG